MKRSTIRDLIIIFLVGLIPLLWFKGGEIIVGHDAGLPFDPVVHFLDRFFVWTQRFGVGTDQSGTLLGATFIHGIEAVLTWLGFSLQWQQKIQFIFWFVLPGFAMYFFAQSIWKDKPYLPLIASIIYMVNFFLIQGWFVAERTKFSIYIAFPLVMYFLLRYMTGKMSFWWSIVGTGVVLGIFNGGGSFPLYGGMVFAILVTLVYINFIQANFETIKRTFLYCFGSIIIYFLLNAYWLIPNIFYLSGSFSQELSNAGGTEGALTWAEYLSSGSTFMTLFRGQGIPEWYLNQFHAYADNYLHNPLLIFISFLFPLSAFVSLLIIKTKKDKFYIYLFILIALIGILFSSGPQSQLGIIYETMVRYVPGFAMFRSAFYKFNYIVWFAYALLIAYTLNYLFSFVEKRFFQRYASLFAGTILGLFTCAYVLYHYPVLTGSFFDYSREPQKELTTRTTVPDYVFEFGKWVNKQDTNKRFLIMPELHPDTSYISYQWKYWSLAPISSLLSRNSFVHNTALVSSTERLLMSQMYMAFLKGDMESFKDFTDFFGIDAIVLQKDYDWQNPTWGTTNPEAYEKILRENPRFKLDKAFGQWQVYKIVDRDKSLRISASNSLNYFQGDLKNIVSFPYFNPKSPLYMGGTKDDAYFANAATGIFLGADCIACALEQEDTGFKVYNPKLLPGSFLYNYVVVKGEDKLKSQLNDFKAKVNYYITTSDRRAVEIKWMVEFKQNIPHLGNTIVRHGQALQELKKILNDSDWGINSAEEEELVKMINGHLLTQSTLITSVHNSDMVEMQNRIHLATSYNLINEIKDTIKDKQWITENANEKKYLFKLPTPGRYEAFVKKGTLANPQAQSNQFSLVVREQSKTLRPQNQIEDWISFGTIDSPSTLLHLTFTDPTAVNLLKNATPLLPSGDSGILKLSNSYVMTGDSVNKCFGLPIRNLDVGKNDKYLISFSYRNFTSSKTLSYNVDSKLIENVSLRTKETVLPTRPNWTVFKASFTPTDSDLVLNFCNEFIPVHDLEGSAPWLEFEATKHGTIEPDEIQDQESAVRVSEVRDISIAKLSEPNVVLYRKTQDKEEINTPVSFVKKNPVEYEVTLEKTSNPTYVTLRESYAKYWQLCDEQKKCMSFDDKSHFANAGFANAWYLPENMGKKLTLHYYPQRWYTIGTIVTIVSAIIIVGGICWTILRKR